MMDFYVSTSVGTAEEISADTAEQAARKHIESLAFLPNGQEVGVAVLPGGVASNDPMVDLRVLVTKAEDARESRP